MASGCLVLLSYKRVAERDHQSVNRNWKRQHSREIAEGREDAIHTHTELAGLVTIGYLT